MLHSDLTHPSNMSPLLNGLGIMYVVVAYVPSICRMCFTNVDDQKLYAVAILFIEISEAHGPLDERRSGEAAEDKRDGLLASEIRQPNCVLSIFTSDSSKSGAKSPSFGA